MSENLTHLMDLMRQAKGSEGSATVDVDVKAEPIADPVAPSSPKGKPANFSPKPFRRKKSESTEEVKPEPSKTEAVKPDGRVKRPKPASSPSTSVQISLHPYFLILVSNLCMFLVLAIAGGEAVQAWSQLTGIVVLGCGGVGVFTKAENRKDWLFQVGSGLGGTTALYHLIVGLLNFML